MQVLMNSRYNPYFKPLKISIPESAPMISINPRLQPGFDFMPYYHIGTFYQSQLGVQPSQHAVSQPSQKNGLKFGIDTILGLNKTSSSDSTIDYSNNTQQECGRWSYEASSLASKYCLVSSNSSPTSSSSSYSPTCDNARRIESEESRSTTSPESSDCVNSSYKSPPPAETEKCKRARTIFSADQMARLEQEFSRSQYMVGQERTYLAQILNLSENQVKIWFQNRRIKWRKQHIENRKLKAGRTL